MIKELEIWKEIKRRFNQPSDVLFKKIFTRIMLTAIGLGVIAVDLKVQYGEHFSPLMHTVLTVIISCSGLATLLSRFFTLLSTGKSLNENPTGDSKGDQSAI
jgi:hypothetical protein